MDPALPPDAAENLDCAATRPAAPPIPSSASRRRSIRWWSRVRTCELVDGVALAMECAVPRRILGFKSILAYPTGLAVQAASPSRWPSDRC